MTIQSSQQICLVPRRMLLVLVGLCLVSVQGFSGTYLNTLAIGNTPDDRPPGPESIVPEEYYGFMNPMANCWPGSKHEEYGGYLRNLKGNSHGHGHGHGHGLGQGGVTNVGGRSNCGGYLDTLNDIQSLSTTFSRGEFQ